MATQLYYMAVWRDGKKIEILNDDGSRMFLTWTEAVQWSKYYGKGVVGAIPCPHKTPESEASQ